MEFKDQDLRLVMNRALRSVLIAIAVGIPIIWFAWGWPSAVLYLVGGGIAATGILEWRQLMTAVLVRLDTNGGQNTPKAAGTGSLLVFCPAGSRCRRPLC